MHEHVPTSNSAIPVLRQVTLRDIVHRLGDGRSTVEQLVNAYLACIDEVNHEFHAVIQTNPAPQGTRGYLTRKRATPYDIQERLNTPSRYPLPLNLHCVVPGFFMIHPTGPSKECPFSSKKHPRARHHRNNMRLTRACRPSKGADMVTALRSAGAIILGKTNMGEWSGFRSTSGCSS
jgi:amidase